MTFESSGAGSFRAAGEKEIRVHELQFDTTGKAGLIGLHLVNLFFMILTLMVYRFWALTRVRRAVWPRMRLDGAPLEYTGSGLEIFVGFLKVFFIILLPYSLFSNWIQMSILTPPVDPGLVWMGALLGLPVLFFIGAAKFLAYRYRVNRTQWRGIRGIVRGKAYEYGLLTLWVYFVTAITFGIMKPWGDVKLFGYKAENTFIGGNQIQFAGSTSGLWRPYLLLVGAFIATYAAVFWLLTDQTALLLLVGLFTDATPNADFPITFSLFFRAVVLIALIFGTFAAYMNYRSAFYRLMSQQMAVQNGRPHLGFGGLDLAKLVIGNFLILVCSLGLLYPLVWLRNGAFVARHLRIIGDLDESNFVQAEFDTETSGEGFIGDFDLA